MASYPVSTMSLTPSRPAPAAPLRKGSEIQNVLSNSGYGSSFSVGTSSASGSSSSTYSGIGGSPDRTSDSLMNAHIVRYGTVSVKEDGLVSWLWRPKYLVLKQQTLSIHKNEVCNPLFQPRHSAYCPPECTNTNPHLSVRHRQHRAHGPQAVLPLA